MSDKELYEKCCFCGAQARKWSKKFAALLPEVEKRALYKKHGFYSIFEFAAKLAGMSRETVVEILRVARKLEDMPLLREQMETQGWGKLRVVATFATKENEKMLAEKVKEMSKVALVTFLQEIKKEFVEIVKSRTGSAEGDGGFKGLSAAPPLQAQQDVANLSNLLDSRFSLTAQLEQISPRVFVRLLLKPKTELRLKELQKKLSKKIGAPVDLNEVMETLLDAYEKGRAPEIQTQQKPQTVRTLAAQIRRQALEITRNTATSGLKRTRPPKPVSRYIPAQIKKTLYAKYGGRCAFPGCNKLPDIYHHTRRFSLYPNHDPDFLMPLCKAHEQLAHHGLIENEERPAKNWRVQFEPDKSAAKYWVDRKVNAFRRLLNNGETQTTAS